jgi:hypothetical protein
MHPASSIVKLISSTTKPETTYHNIREMMGNVETMGLTTLIPRPDFIPERPNKLRKLRRRIV